MKIYMKSVNFRKRLRMIRDTRTTLSPSFEEDEVEMEVADILLNLPNLIAKSEARFWWGAKRKRSALESLPSPPPPPRRTRLVADQRDAERRPKVVGAETWSPATPLSFSPSEADEIPKHSHKKSSEKRTREELLQIINASTERRELLTGENTNILIHQEVEKVRRHYEQLMATNFALKQQLNIWREKGGEPQLDIKQSKIEATVGSPAVEKQCHGQRPFVMHHQTFIVNQTVYGPPMGEKTPHTRDQLFQLLSTGSRVAPHGPSNAKESFVMESSQPLDLTRVVMDKRAQAAEARKNRMAKIKEMKGGGISN